MLEMSYIIPDGMHVLVAMTTHPGPETDSLCLHWDRVESTFLIPPQTQEPPAYTRLV